jgi:hypothetical protein
MIDNANKNRELIKDDQANEILVGVCLGRPLFILQRILVWRL